MFKNHKVDFKMTLQLILQVQFNLPLPFDTDRQRRNLSTMIRVGLLALEEYMNVVILSFPVMSKNFIQLVDHGLANCPPVSTLSIFL